MTNGSVVTSNVSGENETMANMNLPILLADAADNAGGALFGFGIFTLLLAFAVFIFWVWMLIDALTNTRLEPPARIVWLLIIFFLPFLGGLVYLVVGRQGKAVV